MKFQKALASLICLVPSTLVLPHLSSCKPHEEEKKHTISLTNDGNFSLSQEEYVEGKFEFVTIRDQTENETIIGVEKVDVIDEMERHTTLEQGADFQVAYFDDYKRVQLSEFNLYKLNGNLEITLRVKYTPPKVEYNIIVDTESVETSVDKAKEGEPVSTKLTVNSTEDVLEVDKIEYVKIGETTLEPDQYQFNYEESTLEINNGSLVVGDIHVAVAIAEKYHKINVKTSGPQGVKVVSSLEDIKNHESLITQLTISFTSNDVLSFGDITISIGDQILEDDQYKFNVDWSLTTVGTLSIPSQDLIKKDITINVSVNIIQPQEHLVFFYDGENSVQSPYTASNLFGYTQEEISAFYYGYLFNDTTKVIQKLVVEVDDGHERYTRLVENVDYKYESDTLTIDPEATRGNIRVSIYLEGNRDSDFASDQWEWISHYITASKNLSDTNEKDYLLQLYHPPQESFVGIENTNKLKYGEENYKLRVIGQEQDTIDSSDPFYKKEETKAFLTLQVTTTIDGLKIGSTTYEQSPNKISWTDSNPAKKDVEETIFNNLPGWAKKNIRTVSKNRYSDAKEFEITKEPTKTFALSWSEFGRGEEVEHATDWGKLMTEDGMPDDDTYSYYEYDAEQKRQSLANGNRVFIPAPTDKNGYYGGAYISSLSDEGKGNAIYCAYESFDLYYAFAFCI